MLLAADMGMMFKAWITPVEKIGEGQFRKVFRCDPFAIKILKEVLVKKQFRGMAQLPLQPYVRKKYGIADFNRHEFEHYQLLAEILPAHLQRCFNPIHWAGHHQGLNISLSDLVLNDDGTPAQPLTRSGIIENGDFWNTLAEIEHFLLDHKLYFTGVNSDNILVRRTEGIMQPVVVDYKWLGREAYPCQFWLRSNGRLEKKLQGKFQQMRFAHQLFSN
ncbi:MAG TPA: hypothetical protein VK737_02310 [Opitutales bacterium]|jgi:hypothetical protein|nr:hypothetical protein [Opitutales bacterium]